MSSRGNPVPQAIPSTYRRAAAFLVDAGIAIGIYLDTIYVGPHAGELGDWTALAAVGLALGYWLAGDAIFGGATLGKKWFGLITVHALTGLPCSALQCMIRKSLLMIPPLAFFELITLINGPQRRGDRIAGTFVLLKNPKPVPNRPLRPANLAAIRTSVQQNTPPRRI